VRYVDEIATIRVPPDVEVSRSREPAPGDVVITPDRRRWRVSKVDHGVVAGFIALNLDQPEVLTGGVAQLEWRQADESWLLVDRRRGTERRTQ
jgi:hypothetical protein